MATVEIVTLTDSLDERIKTGVETVTFYDPMTGQEREIELGEANRKHFANHLEKLAKYIDASRVVEKVPAKAAAHVKGAQGEIRKWAQENGYKIGDRGRIKAEIVEAYHKAMNAEAVANTAARADETGLESAPVDTQPASDVESDEDNNSRPVNEDELQAMLLKMAVEGREPTLDDLRMAE